MTIDSVPMPADPVNGEIDLHVTGEAHTLVRTPKSADRVGEADGSGSVKGRQEIPRSDQIWRSFAPIGLILLCVGFGGLGGLAFLRSLKAKAELARRKFKAN
jgi:hypothetical protein